jgi:hypothetical protein
MAALRLSGAKNIYLKNVAPALFPLSGFFVQLLV